MRVIPTMWPQLEFRRSLSAALLAVVLVASPRVLSQTTAAKADRSQKQLRGVLVQARDAVIQLAEQQDALTFGDVAPEKINDLVKWFLLIDDREDLRYLQRHLPEKYAVQIGRALEPATTREDFAKRVQVAETEKEAIFYDSRMQQIVSQEIERGFVGDAAANAERMRTPLGKTRSLAGVAVA